jgi:hypothetical protein
MTEVTERDPPLTSPSMPMSFPVLPLSGPFSTTICIEEPREGGEDLGCMYVCVCV